MARANNPSNTATHDLHTRFLAALPRIKHHAGFYFRQVKCPVRKEEAVAETLALAWAWFARLDSRGRDASAFVSTLALLAARAVRSGRRVCGQERSKEVLSPFAQRRHGFTVEALLGSLTTPYERLYAQPHGQHIQDAFEERLSDNRQTPVPEQVAFRLDWPAFFATLPERDRRLAEFLGLGHSAQHAATAFGVSPARVTQLRKRWCRDWQRFQDTAVAAA